MIARRYIPVLVGAVAALGFPFYSHAAETEKSIEDTTVIEETIEGEAEPEQTYEQDGRIYNLESSDVEYIYDRRPTGETIEITEMVSLPTEDVTLIPKEKTDGNIVYVLDESSLNLQVAEYGESEGTRQREYWVEIPDLPDNDMQHIETEMDKDGIHYVLTDVDYTVTDYDENGIPTRYTAKCKYEGAEPYTVSIPVRWQTPARYVGQEMEKYIRQTKIRATYSYFENAELPEPVLKTEEKTENLLEKKFPVTAIAVGTAGGVIIAVLGYFFVFTVPVYAVTAAGYYKRVGRAKVRHRKNHYAARISGYVCERAETNDYKIKIPKRVLRRSDLEIFEINCPDGAILQPKLQQEVKFRIPG